MNHEDIKDNTILGYALPDAAQIQNTPIKLEDQRSLNLQQFQIERFFLHACLYLACGDQNENQEVFI